MVKENIQVDKLLQPKPESEDLDYPTEPHYELALSDETTAKRRQREQRNQKRRTYWQNLCKEIEDKGPQVDNIPWDEADNKANKAKGNKHISSETPTYRLTELYNRFTCARLYLAYEQTLAQPMKRLCCNFLGL